MTSVVIVAFLFALALVFLIFPKGDENIPRREVVNAVRENSVEPRGPSELIERSPEVIPDPRIGWQTQVYPPRNGISAQYSNPSLSFKDKHPVLAYQYSLSKGINPANLGDPIRVHNVGGGAQGLYGEPSVFAEALTVSRGSIPISPDDDEGASYSRRREAYSGEEGPYPGKPQNVPVPAGAMKASNEQFNPDMFRFSPLAVGTVGSAVPFLGPTNAPPWSSSPGNQGSYHIPYSGALPQVTAPGSDFPPQTRPLYSGDFFRPYGPNVPVANVPFFGSVNSYAPFPEVNTPWEKSGILTSISTGRGGDSPQILNLYRRAIAPLQDLWEYQVQDKNGFVIKLHAKYLQDGDIVPHVAGKEGSWKVHDYVQNKYIWV